MAGSKESKLFFKKKEAAIHIGLLNHHYAVQLTKPPEQQGNTKKLLLEISHDDLPHRERDSPVLLDGDLAPAAARREHRVQVEMAL